jgi:hypothetical protein
MWCKTFGPFALRISVGNPRISFSKFQFFRICLFVNGVCYVLYRVSCSEYYFNLFFFKEFCNFFVSLLLYVKVAHLIFYCCGLVFCHVYAGWGVSWLGLYYIHCSVSFMMFNSFPFVLYSLDRQYLIFYVHTGGRSRSLL